MKIIPPTPKQALDLTFIDRHDTGDEYSIRSYFAAQLAALWNEGEGFSGKRPFGNSGWEGVLEEPLVKAGCIGGSVRARAFDEDTNEYVDIRLDEVSQFNPEDVEIDVEGVDVKEYDAFIQSMIEEL